MIRSGTFGEPFGLIANAIKESTSANAALPNYLSWQEQERFQWQVTLVNFFQLFRFLIILSLTSHPSQHEGTKEEFIHSSSD